MRDMNKRAGKFIRIGMTIYLAILFMIVLPNHHHKDNAEHSDCKVCALAHQPNLVAIDTISLFIAIVFLFVKIVPAIIPFINQTGKSFQSRAPPSLILFTNY
jgi:hypothetical protein